MRNGTIARPASSLPIAAPGPRRRIPVLLQALGAFLLYLTCSVALFRDAWAAPSMRSIGYYADPQQFMWFLGWISYALGHGQNPFIST